MKNLLYLLLFTLSWTFVSAQTPNQQAKEKLKIGLVLSGGGAKGLAHIGVLKVIDSLGIHIDYIGGTSMGAVVGGLYATGYSGKELDSIFRKTDFTALMQDKLPRKAKTFYEKNQANRYIVSLPFDDFNLRFPTGLSKGQNIYNLMAQLTAHVHQIKDFSKLPIPFFAIAANIETGKTVVLDHGSLALAIAASAAIPSLFTPVEYNGQLLVDGGVLNNYPVKELRKHDLDLIIGVSVQDSLSKRKKLNSAIDILNQINNFEAIQAMEEKKELTDIFIRPDISAYTILSFDKGKGIIHQGEKAARNSLPQLIALAKQQKVEKVKRIPVPKRDSLYINAMILKGENNYPRSYIRGKLKINDNTTISYQQLTYGINNLSSTNNFKRISYNLIPQEKGADLVLDLEESQQKTNLKLAVHYDKLYKSNLLINLTHKSLLLTNDVISIDFILADKLRYNFNYFIDKGRYWSIGFSSRYDQFTTDVSYKFIQQIAPIGNFNVNKLKLNIAEFENRLYVETYFLKDLRLGLGAEHKYIRARTETILVDNPQNQNENLPFTVLEETNLYSALAYLELDTYNKKYFPSHGFHFRGDFNAYLFSSQSTSEFKQFALAKGSFGYAFPISRTLSTRISTEGGFKIGNSGTNTLNFYLGGYGNDYNNNLIPFYGYDFLTITGDSYIKAFFELDYSPIKNHHLIASYNIANVENDLFGYGEWFSLPDYTGFAIGYGLETFLGPVEIKYTHSPETGEDFWFFSVGYWF